MLEFYKFEHFKQHRLLLHYITQKSKAFAYDFSLALHTGQTTEKILQNRKILEQTLDTKTTLHYILANQTHGDTIEIIDKKETKGWYHEKDAIKSCDALITDKTDTMLCILTADCVPVLLYDKKKHIIAAIHAGWKGTKAQIVKKTMNKMQEAFQCDSKDILAGIAPSIGKCCYEVGEEVAQHFFDIEHSYTKVANKYMLDLPYINKMQLLDAGVTHRHIEMSNICTACHTEHYFSYRKEKGCSGRFMSMIALKDRNED